MRDEWVIDGYNLLHWLENSHPKKSPVSREKLLQMLADFASLSASQVTVVLDGVGSEAEFGAFESAQMKVFYSKSATADTFIEKYVYDNYLKSKLVVVTQDTALTRMVRGKGVSVMKPESFVSEMKEYRGDAENILWEKKADQHGFNRPFDKKLKKS